MEYLYKITNDFPKYELYGLTNQIRRVSVSISSNIAEGAGRSSSKEFLQFLYIAIGSLSEIETQLIIAKRLNYIIDTQDDQIIELQKMLLGLMKAVKRNKVN